MREVSFGNTCGNSVQRASNKAIAGRVNRMFLETACHLPLPEKVSRFRFQKVNPAPDPRKHGFSVAITPAEIAPQAALNGRTKKPRNQIRQLGRLLHCRIKATAEPGKVRSVEE